MWQLWRMVLSFGFFVCLLACSNPQKVPQTHTNNSSKNQTSMPKSLETATFGGGCFWCTEAIYQRLKGVHSVISGYSGGKLPNPTYREVCSGTTGHAEVIQVQFDPEIISYPEILTVFFKTHDPTTLNRQGNDVGTQYRSAIFYHSENQRADAESIIKELTQKAVFDNPIVTEITAFVKLYPAEDYHQNYYNDNSNQPYCAVVINPKLLKFEKEFKEKLKSKD